MLEGSEVTGKNKHALGTGIRTMYGIGLSNDRCYIHIYYYIIIYDMHDILTDPNHGTCILVCLAFAQLLLVPAMAKEEKTTHSLLAKKWENIPELRRKAQRLELATCQHQPSHPDHEARCIQNRLFTSFRFHRSP